MKFEPTHIISVGSLKIKVINKGMCSCGCSMRDFRDGNDRSYIDNISHVKLISSSRKQQIIGSF